MPELPEVETICRDLSPIVTGRKITGFELLWEKTLRGISASNFKALITGKYIERIFRRGKYLVFVINDGNSFSIHFRMTGALLMATANQAPPKYTRAIIYLDNQCNLYFTDPRKFGRIEFIDSCNALDTKLGLEPLEAEFTTDSLKEILMGRKAVIKSVLLNQQLIAGIGNMYADEALHLASIHPSRTSDSLTPTEISHLHRAIQAVLRIAIDSKGATVSNYTRPDGQTGSAQNKFKVAHRRGAECPCCHTPIERIVICQRGTYLCPSCQPILQTKSG